MVADAAGNNIDAVGVSLTGSVGIAPAGTAIPTPEEGASRALVLDPAFKKLGLIVEDGGPQWAGAPDGDAIEFWQDGYSLKTGKADVTLVVTLAQTDDATRALIAGAAPDANGYVAVDAGGHSTEYVLFTEEVFRNGMLRRRVAFGTVQAVEETKSERGTVMSYAVTFSIRSAVELDYKHWGEWVLAPAAG